MDIREYISLGDRVDIVVGSKSYRTKVDDVLSGKKFLVSQITKNQKPVYMKPDKVVDMYFYREDAMYVFPVVFKKRHNISEAIVLLEMELAGEAERNQRRDSFRLMISKQVDIWSFSEIVGAELDTYKFEGTTIDLSETGMLLMSEEELTLGDNIYCDIKLEDDEVVTARAQAIRRLAPKNTDKPYVTGFRFVDTTDRFNKTMLRYILQEQIIMRKYNPS